MTTTQDKNAEIARWMGMKLSESLNGITIYSDSVYPKSGGGYTLYYGKENLKYHSDWNWLHQAIDKIEDLGYPIDIFKKAVSIHLDNGEPIVDLCGKNYNTKIEAVHEAVYQFVVWHNQQVKENRK